MKQETRNKKQFVSMFPCFHVSMRGMLLFLCSLLGGVILFVSPVLAQVSTEVPGLILPTTDPRIIAMKIVRVALGFLGLLVVSLIAYGGFVWMTAAGNDENIEKARKILRNAVIGLVIILSALAIVQFVISRLIAATTVPGLPPPAPAPGRVGGGALGSGIVESHYPRRGQINVARNSRVLITFKQPIDPATVSQAVKIIKTADINDTVRESPASKYANFTVTNTEDQRTFVLDPVELLGSATANLGYTVYLCGTASSRGNCPQDGVKLASGGAAFQGRFKDYQWSFETGTLLDITPPQIESVVPIPDNAADEPAAVKDKTDKPRNVIVQVNFNEPVLPTVASGKIVTLNAQGVVDDQGALKPGTFDELRVKIANTETFVAGEWKLGNQYQTAEFWTADLCGRNSCGGEVFCLPGPENLAVEALAASLLKAGEPSSQGLFDGIEDVAGNSLDGNRDGKAQGPTTVFYNLNAPENKATGDNARWSFYTASAIDLTAPKVASTTPETLGTGAALTIPITVTFTKPMARSTLNSSNLELAGTEKATGKFWDTWWEVVSENLPPQPPAPAKPVDPTQTKALIRHGGLWPETGYSSAARSEVKDLFQNCFFPSGGGVCVPTATQPYCCNGAACAKGDVNCRVCGFN